MSDTYTLGDIIDRADLSKASEFYQIEELAEVLEIFGVYDIDHSHPELKKIQHLWVAPWYCTDTWVGLALLILDGEVVGYTKQQARKSDLEFYFLDDRLAERVRDVLRKCVRQHQQGVAHCSRDDVFGPAKGFKVNCASETLVVKEVIYNGELCERVRNAGYGWNSPLRLIRPNGEHIEVSDMTKITVPYQNLTASSA